VPSDSTIRVEPSVSVNRNVTSPTGRPPEAMASSGPPGATFGGPS
jgi:hypothetical protein